MADPISLLASGVQANVATVMSGQTPTLVGLRGGTIPLALQQKGAAVDLTNYALARLVLDVTAMSNRYGFENGRPDAASLRVTVETAPASGGPWTALYEFSPQRDLGQQRVKIAAFDRFVRASWFYVADAYPSRTITDAVSFTFSLTGEAA